jgi:hypothetical protein
MLIWQLSVLVFSSVEVVVKVAALLLVKVLPLPCSLFTQICTTACTTFRNSPLEDGATVKKMSLKGESGFGARTAFEIKI